MLNYTLLAFIYSKRLLSKFLRLTSLCSLAIFSKIPDNSEVLNMIDLRDIDPINNFITEKNSIDIKFKAINNVKMNSSLEYNADN